MGRLFRLGEVAFVVVALLLFSNAFIGPYFAPGQKTTDDLLWLRYLWLPIYAVTLVLLAVRFTTLFEATPAALLFLLVVVWAMASQVWSIDGDTTQRRGVALFSTTLFGVYVAARFSGGRFVPILGGVLIFLAAASLVTVFVNPALGVHHGVNDGDWRGLWYEKNSMGAVMATGTFTCVAAALTGARKAVWIVGAAFCAFLVVMSRSEGALISLIVAGGIYVLVWGVRRGPLTGIGVALAGAGAALLGGSLLWLAPEAVFKAAGKDPTLTGRTEVWASLFRLLGQRPLLGYGYGAFWEENSNPANIVRRETGWTVPAAHNGWIDVLIQVGWIGGALMLLAALAVVGAALVRGMRVRDGYWSIALVATFLIRSLSESVLIEQNSFDWVLFVIAGTTLLMPLGAPIGRAYGRMDEVEPRLLEAR